MSRNSRIRAKKARETKTEDTDSKKVFCGETNGVKVYAIYKK